MFASEGHQTINRMKESVIKTSSIDNESNKLYKTTALFHLPIPGNNSGTICN